MVLDFLINYLEKSFESLSPGLQGSHHLWLGALGITNQMVMSLYRCSSPRTDIGQQLIICTWYYSVAAQNRE